MEKIERTSTNDVYISYMSGSNTFYIRDDNNTYTTNEVEDIIHYISENCSIGDQSLGTLMALFLDGTIKNFTINKN